MIPLALAHKVSAANVLYRDVNAALQRSLSLHVVELIQSPQSKLHHILSDVGVTDRCHFKKKQDVLTPP